MEGFSPGLLRSIRISCSTYFFAARVMILCKMWWWNWTFFGGPHRTQDVSFSLMEALTDVKELACGADRKVSWQLKWRIISLTSVSVSQEHVFQKWRENQLNGGMRFDFPSLPDMDEWLLFFGPNRSSIIYKKLAAPQYVFPIRADEYE